MLWKFIEDFLGAVTHSRSQLRCKILLAQKHSFWLFATSFIKGKKLISLIKIIVAIVQFPSSFFKKMVHLRSVL